MVAKRGGKDPVLRLDVVLVKRGLVASRARALDLIRQGRVRVAGHVVAKAAAGVAAADHVEVVGDHPYVSRGAVKLAAALDHFGFPVAGVIALDIGASTGGFTEVLIERGAARVYAVDVGHGQLHQRLGEASAVVSLEGLDARRLDRRAVPDPIGAIVCDVSFISLKKALPAALALAGPAAWLVALIKPQFEAGRAAVGKGGIVRDPAARQAAVAGVRAWLGDEAGWQVVGVMASPIAGRSGNQEFLIGALHGR
jgi:23S rRNA (cytidine1920-2'-O)/16S rRNA (cytidine1409-2'-O)-methyltransferase